MLTHWSYIFLALTHRFGVIDLGQHWFRTSDNGLLPDGTKPLHESMLVHYQWDSVTFTWGLFHWKCSQHQSLRCLEIIHIKLHPHPQNSSQGQRNTQCCQQFPWLYWTLSQESDQSSPPLYISWNVNGSTLVQVMAWYTQASSNYLSQYWPRSVLPYGITRQGSTLSFLAGCPKSHFLGWYRNFLLYRYLNLDNQVVNSTCPKDKLGGFWRADDP